MDTEPTPIARQPLTLGELVKRGAWFGILAAWAHQVLMLTLSIVIRAATEGPVVLSLELLPTVLSLLATARNVVSVTAYGAVAGGFVALQTWGLSRAGLKNPLIAPFLGAVAAAFPLSVLMLLALGSSDGASPTYGSTYILFIVFAMPGLLGAVAGWLTMRGVSLPDAKTRQGWIMGVPIVLVNLGAAVLPALLPSR